MSAQIVVGVGQDIDEVLRAFRCLVTQENARPWYKRRYGYYEKPSALRRKRQKMCLLRGGKGRHPVYPRPPRKRNPEYKDWVCPPSYVNLDTEELWARTGLNNAAGHQRHPPIALAKLFCARHATAADWKQSHEFDETLTHLDLPRYTELI